MKRILVGLLMSSVGFYAKAGLLVEPHIGYDMSSVTKNATATPTIDSGFKTSAPSFGARLGYASSKLFWIAADVDYATGKNAYNNTATYPANYNFTRADYYALVGIDFPKIIRAWAGYGFLNQMTLQTPGGDTVVTGASIKGGIGFEFIPKVSINIEYIVRNMADEKIGSAASAKIATTYSTYKDAGALVSISVPLMF